MKDKKYIQKRSNTLVAPFLFYRHSTILLPNLQGKIKEKISRILAFPALSKAIELINQTNYSGTNLTLFFCQNAIP
jgi:fucose 4-O-acetylase-like acetyltransferase